MAAELTSDSTYKAIAATFEFNRVVISVYIRSPLAMRAVGFSHFMALKVMDAIFLAVSVNAVPATQRII